MKSFSRSVWGILLIVIGAGFLLDTTGIYNFNDLISTYWPVIFLIIAASDFSEKKYLNSSFWAVLGGILLLRNLTNLEFNFWSLIWPMIIIWIGMGIILNQSKKSKTEVVDNDINVSSSFNESEKKFSSKCLRSGTVNTIFGSSKIDLRDALIAKNGAIIDCLVVFGGVEVIVPENVYVKQNAFVLVGDIEDKRKSRSAAQKDKPTIEIRGTVVFGGIEIKE